MDAVVCGSGGGDCAADDGGANCDSAIRSTDLCAIATVDGVH